jgi:hypothetical protein
MRCALGDHIVVVKYPSLAPDAASLIIDDIVAGEQFQPIEKVIKTVVVSETQKGFDHLRLKFVGLGLRYVDTELSMHAIVASLALIYLKLVTKKVEFYMHGSRYALT